MPLCARVLLVSSGRCQTEPYFLVVHLGKGTLVTANACYPCGVWTMGCCRNYTHLCVLWPFELESYLNIQFLCFYMHLAVP